jgi:murein DD-endopeptidase MepM/ murein hydrolase activator NlpD
MRLVTSFHKAPVLSVFAVLAAAGTAQARPWEAREPSAEPKPAHQLRTPASTWPAEPEMPPAPLDPAKFTAAWAGLCGVTTDSATAALAPKILAAASSAKSDPFTLAALARYGSRCDPAYKGKGNTYGLLAIEPGMYRSPGAPELPVDKGDLTSKRLLDPEVNLNAGAALLEMWNASHKEIDAAFGGGLHRSGVAHFTWGDVVRSSGQEDLILTTRRRMILTYLGNKDAPRQTPYIGLAVVSPLEAIPRVATSGPGDDRSGGARQHRGLDIAGMLGEPVRAIADGTVIFAGINSPGRSRMGGIPPEKIARYRHRRMGVGGIYVCIEHTPEPKRVVSCYMHLGGYNVAEREEVKAGQVIGELGRTGVKVSPPHLHLEVRVGNHYTNPIRTLGDYVIPPKATMTHQYVLRAKRAKRLRA